MYSRSTWESRAERSPSYSIPAGYDGSRFRRRRSGDRHGDGEEVILVPDSGFASYAPVDETDGSSDNGELSVGGIPTALGKREHQKQLPESGSERAASRDGEVAPITELSEKSDDKVPERPHEKLSGILEKLGFTGGLSSDELLICTMIFLIASDRDNNGKNAGDILLILALLLGFR